MHKKESVSKVHERETEKTNSVKARFLRDHA